MTIATYKRTGRLDGASAPTHEQALKELLVGDISSLDVDLSELDYVSSAGLRVLLVAAKAVEAQSTFGCLGLLWLNGFGRQALPVGFPLA